MKIILNIGGFEKVIESTVFAPKYFHPWRCRNGTIIELEFLLYSFKGEEAQYRLSESGHESLSYLFKQYATYRVDRNEIEELRNKLLQQESKSRWQKFKELWR